LSPDRILGLPSQREQPAIGGVAQGHLKQTVRRGPDQLDRVLRSDFHLQLNHARGAAAATEGRAGLRLQAADRLDSNVFQQIDPASAKAATAVHAWRILPEEVDMIPGRGQILQTKAVLDDNLNQPHAKARMAYALRRILDLRAQQRLTRSEILSQKGSLDFVDPLRG